MNHIDNMANQVIKFLKTKHIKDMLDYFNSNNLNGWEKWLQFEIGKFLDINQYPMDLECSYSRDKRKNKIKQINRLDIVCRKVNTNTDYFLGIELKINQYPEYSIKPLLEDLKGIQEITKKDWEFRSIAGIAFYSHDIIYNRNYSKYKELVNKLNKKKLCKLLTISGWECLIISWNASNISDKNNIRLEYSSFIKKILNLASDSDIII